jgi:hypothetical protein
VFLCPDFGSGKFLYKKEPVGYAFSIAQNQLNPGKAVSRRVAENAEQKQAVIKNKPSLDWLRHNLSYVFEFLGVSASLRLCVSASLRE